MATFFNLSHAGDMTVGNDRIHGVRGGEKRRIGIAEAFSRASLLQCYDNYTRGLDSKTALSLVRLMELSAKYAERPQLSASIKLLRITTMYRL